MTSIRTQDLGEGGGLEDLVRWAVAAVIRASCLALFATVAVSQPLFDGELAAIGRLLRVVPGGSFADVGAGSGFWTIKLAGLVGPSGRVFATETKPNLVRNIELIAARDGLSQVKVFIAEDRDSKLFEQCCDGVLMRFVYHDLRDPKALMQGLAKSIKPGGRLLIIDYNPSVRELKFQMRQFNFECVELAEPWAEHTQTYGALFVKATP
jgi:tRNA A58 N-methylase Trm61